MSIPVLMYHEVEHGDTVAKRYTVTSANFSRHLQRLREQQCEVVSLADCLRIYRDGGQNDGRRRVVLTFDDSHLVHFQNSLPLLQQYGVKATFFVVTRFLGEEEQWLNKDHILAMHRAGMDIQSHTHTHRYLDTLAPDQVREELYRSKVLLEDWLGRAVDYVSCPGGRYDARTIDIAHDVGYRAVCNSVPGLGPSRHATPLLPRFLITSKTGLPEYDRITLGEPGYVRRQRVAYSLKHAAKRVLGNNLYYSVWKKLIRS